MSRLQKLVDHMIMFIVEYHQAQTKTTDSKTLLSLQAMDTPILVGTLQQLITESQSSGYSSRESLLNYILYHIEILKPRLEDNALNPDTFERLSAPVLVNCIATLQMLLNHPQDKKFPIEVGEKLFELKAFKRTGMLGTSLSLSGNKIQHLLSEFKLHTNEFKIVIENLCKDHAAILRDIQSTLYENSILKQENAELKKNKVELEELLIAAKKEILLLETQLKTKTVQLPYGSVASMPFTPSLFGSRFAMFPMIQGANSTATPLSKDEAGSTSEAPYLMSNQVD